MKEPKIGSKQDKKTRHMLKSGFKKLLIRNEKDIELLLMNNRVYAGELAQCLSAKTRYVNPTPHHLFLHFLSAFVLIVQESHRGPRQGTQREIDERSGQA